MEPVTLITTALAAAAKNGISEAVKDGYAALKRRLIERFGVKADVSTAIGQVEQKPESTARQFVLDEEVRASGAQNDAELASEAQSLLDLLKEQGPIASTKYQAYQTGSGAIAQGSGAVAAGEGGVAAGGNVSGNAGANRDREAK